MSKNFACIILAAGKGTRMKSETPKVLHKICGRPMLAYVLDLAEDLKIDAKVVVTGHGKELLGGLLSEYKAKSVYQDKLLGTADAVRRTEGLLKNFKGHCIILYGDQPLLKLEVLKDLIKKHIATGAGATILTAYTQNPYGYGRIIRNNFSRIQEIVEEKDATGAQREISEVNTGIICFKKDLLFKIIKEIKPNNAKKEYYLTDTIKIIAQRGLVAESHIIVEDIEQAQGINNRGDLAQAQKIMNSNMIAKFMEDGVTIVDPNATYIDYGCKIGQDTIIYPFTVIEKNVKIGKFCSIGPFCHLRGETVVRDKVTVGNYTEITRSRVGEGTFMKHFSYLGDAFVSENVNIGCGTVTANFDGKNKQKTFVGKGAFIGSDTVIVAPIKVGEGAITGAGSVVTKDVKSGKIVAGVPAKEIKKTQDIRYK